MYRNGIVRHSGRYHRRGLRRGWVSAPCILTSFGGARRRDTAIDFRCGAT